MKPLGIVATALVLIVALACGGGSSSSSSAPSAPSTPTPPPTPTTITVYAAYDKLVTMKSWDPEQANMVALDDQWFSVGWNYFDGSILTPPQGRVFRSEMAAVKFDLPTQVIGRTVTKTTLRLYLASSTYISGVRRDLKVRPQIKVNAFTQSWDPKTLTWNIWSALGTQSTGEVSVPAPDTNALPLYFDVTTVVRNWASGAWGNDGLKLSTPQYPDPGYESAAGTTFQSVGHYNTPEQRPQLIIEYL